MKLALEGMLKPEEREVELGHVLVQQVFKISRVGTVAGCRVLSGVVGAALVWVLVSVMAPPSVGPVAGRTRGLSPPPEELA